MYKIIITRSAEKQLNKLDKEVRKRITSSIKRIKIRPYAHVKKLTEQEGYSLRVGDYRIILDIYENELVILVIKVGHRRDVYK